MQRSDGGVDLDNNVMLHTLSKEELLDLFHTLGTQLSFVWNAFLRYHRYHFLVLERSSSQQNICLGANPDLQKFILLGPCIYICWT